METLVKLFADGALVLVLAVAGLCLLWELRRDFWQRTPLIIMAGLTSLLVGKIMSLLYQPETMRPFQKMGLEAGAAYVNNPGFPSDHALLAAAAVLAVYVICRTFRWLAYPMALLVVLMCVARVIALVHTPADVIFGVLAGLSGGIWYKKLTK